MNQPCTALISSDGKLSSVDIATLRADLESKDIQKKRNAVKSAIIQMSNGKDMSELLMTVIRFCVTVDDHELAKLLHIYWECAQRCDEKGELKPEMILVCNAVMNNLKHANEYVRGCTLRFLSKITEEEILEPLIPSIKENLEHHSPYVRRNAVLAIYSIYKLYGDHMLNDAPEYIYELLHQETDLSTRRNAFSFLMECKQPLAVEFLEENCDEIGNFGVCFQLVALDLIRTVCSAESSQKGRFIKPLQSMLNSDSPSVAYESAATLVSLSAAPSAVKASTNTLLSLLASQTDNNVKIVILSRLEVIIEHNSRLLEENVMELLAVLKTPSSEIRGKVLKMAGSMTSNRNVNEVINYLKNEIVKNGSDNDELGCSYREMLVKSIHDITVKYPFVAGNVVLLLLDYLNTDSGYSILLLVKEMLYSHEASSPSILAKLLEVFPSIEKEEVCHIALWICSEYCEGEVIRQAFYVIQSSIGPFPLHEDIKIEQETKEVVASAPTVLQDGTYASQSYIDTTSAEEEKADENVLPLRHLLLQPSFFTCCVLCDCLMKLCLKNEKVNGDKKMKIDSLLIMNELLIEYESKIDGLSYNWISRCINCLLCRDMTEMMASMKEMEEKVMDAIMKKNTDNVEEKESTSTKSNVDDVIVFKQLRDKSSLGIMIDIDDNTAIQQVTQFDKEMTYNEKLKHIKQLTGYSDPIYCEAVVYMKDFDIIMEITMINRTNMTMTDVSMELSVTGSFNILEKPSKLTLDAGEKKELRSIIKVTCTETGYIFGSITFCYSSSAERAVVNLNEIYISLMTYIQASICTDKEFRQMWSKFDWENKIVVNTNITSLSALVHHIAKLAHLSILTPISDKDECDFLSTNLYARSMFEEDVLVNISIEKTPTGISGYYLIRSNTQGVAVSLGDIIKMGQKDL